MDDEIDKMYWQALIWWAIAEEPPVEPDPGADAAALDHIAAAALHG